MSYIKIVNDIKKGKVDPVYFVYGTEQYFIDHIKKVIAEKAAGGEKDNISFFDLEEISVQEVIQDVETFPFFGERKVVFASNPVFLKAKMDKLPFEHDVSLLEQYVANPADYSVLVLVAPYEKVDERKKVAKVLKKYATVVPCQPVKEKEIGDWISSIAEELHITVTEDAREVLETELAENLQLLEEELKKFALFVGEGGLVTREVVGQLLSQTANSTSLRLADAVMGRNLAEAIRIFKDLEKLKEDPISLIGLLAFQFRTILRVKLLRQKGYTQYQIQKQLKLHPYVVKIAMNREKHFSVEKLENIIHQIAETDGTMKRGEMEKDLAFEMLLYKLIEQ